MDHLVTAEDYHAHLVKTFRIEGRVRLEFIEALLGFCKSRLFRNMGYTSIAQYAESEFRLAESTTFDFLRVARRLKELPLLREAFGSGQVAWSVISNVTKVAAEGTEKDWLDGISKNG